MNINRIAGWLKLSAVTLVFSVVFSSAALAASGGLQIIVTDADGNPVAGANVLAKTPASLTQRSGVTNADGELRLMGLDPSDEYEVTVTATGFQGQRNQGVLVVTDRVYSVPFSLNPGETLEEIVTYGRSQIGQLVDTTSALQSTDVTLEVLESLPTGRSYQSYLQFAPTTKPSAVEQGGNPSSKSGVNYQDIVDQNGNTAGTSSDNVYYVDGINVTDNNTGTFGSNFNSEIIQEQQIITGGVPAEYEGGQGLISRVITKSGSNEWHGSVNYYTQSDSLVADNDNLPNAGFSDFDAAFTLGGPIIRDKLWFFASLQRKDRDEDVIDPVSGNLLRSINTKQDLGFGKITWQPTENDKVTAIFFNDPYDRTGSTSTTVVANRDLARTQGGDNYKFEYSHAWENLIVSAAYINHEGEVTDVAADPSTFNDVAFTSDLNPTNADLQQGGSGSNIERLRNKESIDLTLEWFLEAGKGSHEIKAGYSQVTNESSVNLVYTGDGSQYTSLSIQNPGLTFDDYTNLDFTGSTRITAPDLIKIADNINASSDLAYFVGLLDTDASGDISPAEVGAYEIQETTGNPSGDFNVYRIAQLEQGLTLFKTEGDVFYVQDTWNIDDHWTINAGVRAEKWDHIASNGTKVFSFDYEYAPRLSLVYDIKGDGASKVWGFYGRYYDPIRTNMTAFAGTFSGSVRSEQAYIGNQWIEWQPRGGAQNVDGFFAPTTKTPYTDEFMIGYERALTENQSIAITYTDRETNDIMEDYDLELYTTPSLCGDLCLGLEYFGFTTAPDANFFIATLAGAKREYQGLEVSWRKRRSADSRWFAIASYSYNDATGNSNSDSNADFQGDLLYLDPRAVNMTGKQPGNIEHLVKLAGSYSWDNGFEVGATYAWNSGTIYSETELRSRRHLPIRVAVGDEFESDGITTRWADFNTVGTQTSASYGTLNARAKYVVDFGSNFSAEFFLDIFNVLDSQDPRREQDLRGGDGVYSFGQASAWTLPRRFYLGTRVSF